MKITLGPVEVAHEHRAAQSKWDWGDGGNAQFSAGLGVSHELGAGCYQTGILGVSICLGDTDTEGALIRDQSSE